MDFLTLMDRKNNVGRILNFASDDWTVSKEFKQIRLWLTPHFVFFLKKTFTDSSHFFDGSKIPMKFLNGLRHLFHSHKGIIFSFELCSSLNFMVS